jgi:hypothetical protein
MGIKYGPKFYMVLISGYMVLAIYRVRNDGQLKWLRQPPNNILWAAQERRAGIDKLAQM